MNFRLILFFSGITTILFSCSNAPAEDEVKQKLIGSYCSEFHKLELHSDGMYLNQRVHRGALSGTPVIERCEGPWKLEWEGGWKLVLEKSTKNSTPVSKCSGMSHLVWKKGEGYTFKDSLIVLEEMFEKVKVEKGKCD